MAFLRRQPQVTKDVCIYQGGYGSGKTFVGVVKGLIIAQKFHGCFGVVVAKEFTLLRDTTIQMYQEVMSDWGLEEGRDYTHNKSDQRLTLHCWGGSVILFKHGDDPEKLKSINATWIHIEEASQLSEAAFLMLVSRARNPKFPLRYIFGTTNPQPTKGWIHKHFVEKAGIREYENPDGSKDIVHYRRVIAPSTDNKALTADYLEDMKHSYDPEYYAINVLGEDGDYTAGLVYKDYCDLNEEDNEYKPDFPLHITCDFNVDPMMWCLVQRYNGEFHVFDELVKENTTTIECVEAFAERYPPDMVKGGIVINGDASGDNRSTQAAKANETNYKQMRSELSRLGYRNVKLDIREANPGIMGRIMAVNASLCNKQGHRRLLINPNTCKWLKYNFENQKYIEGTSDVDKPTKDAIKKDRNAKFLVHITEAIGYHVEKYAPIVLKTPYKKRKPIPQIQFEI